MSHHRTRFYAVQESRDNPEDRWILAAFSVESDADQFVGEVAGTVHTINDDGLSELVERWNAGDDSVAARALAREQIATFAHDIRDRFYFRDLELFERYQDDATCAALIRLAELGTEASYIISQIVPEGVEKFEGVAVK